MLWRTARLVSPAYGDTWPTDGWAHAECAKCKRPPGTHCSCGIYAALSPRGLVSHGYHDKGGELVACGEVALAGKIVPGDRAHRAERARIVRLWLPWDAWRVGNMLGDAYGVPVHLANLLRFAEVEA